MTIDIQRVTVTATQFAQIDPFQHVAHRVQLEKESMGLGVTGVSHAHDVPKIIDCVRLAVRSTQRA